MRLRNYTEGYGLVSIVLHWLMAVALIGLFALGVYMVELGYYDPFYHDAVTWHEGIGIVTLALLIVRGGWLFAGARPDLLTATAGERLAAKLAHAALYALMLLIPVSGYLISTADGHALEVFGLFKLPSPFGNVEGLEDSAGEVHWWLALALAGLVVLHTLAALKHHFVDRDRTLLRMLVVSSHDKLNRGDTP